MSKSLWVVERVPQSGRLSRATALTHANTRAQGKKDLRVFQNLNTTSIYRLARYVRAEGGRR